jgi:hypothetical protein
MVSSNAGDADGAGAADDDQARVLPAGQRRAHLADALGDRDELRVVATERRWQQRVLDGQAGDAGGLQFLDRALDAERVAIAVVGVDQERQRTGAVDAVGLGGEFTEREHADVGRGQHAERADRTREHHRLETEVAGDARGNSVVDRCGIYAAPAFDNRPQPLAAFRPVHRPLPRSIRAWLWAPF